MAEPRQALLWRQKANLELARWLRGQGEAIDEWLVEREPDIVELSDLRDGLRDIATHLEGSDQEATP